MICLFSIIIQCKVLDTVIQYFSVGGIYIENTGHEHFYAVLGQRLIMAIKFLHYKKKILSFITIIKKKLKKTLIQLDIP